MKELIDYLLNKIYKEKSKTTNILRNNRGYSMVVLVIAIIVIIILASVAVSSLSTSRQRTEMMNFIFDINTMEDRVRNYFIQYGTLPTDSKNDVIDINSLPLEDKSAFLSQLSNYDNENYYYIDLNRLGSVILREEHRSLNGEDSGYFVNEGSLKVYVEKGVKYRMPGDSETITYYTLTPNIVNGQELYLAQDEEIRITGNPLTWVKQAELRVILPRQGIEQSDWDNWIFKWDFGPKSTAELASLGSKNTFKYGTKLKIKSNGIYSILALEPKDATYTDVNAVEISGKKYKPTVLNVNVTKIDDRKPEYTYSEDGTKVSFIDNETGIEQIRFKTKSKYESNVNEANATGEDLTARTPSDYYLMNGSGDDVIYQLGSHIATYATEASTILTNIKNENADYEAYMNEYYSYTYIDEQTAAQAAQRTQEHKDRIDTYNNQLLDLNNLYPYIYDLEGKIDETRLVVFVQDYAGNSIVVGDKVIISTKVLADSYNIDKTPAELMVPKVREYLESLLSNP